MEWSNPLSSPYGEAEGGEAESGADSEARTMANAMMILSKSTNEHCMVRSHDESRGMGWV